MIPEVEAFNNQLNTPDKEICDAIGAIIDKGLPEAENKIWHKHPVWFLNGNPIVGYSKQKPGIRLMFWSGASFEEDALKPGTGKFKDASKFYTSLDQIKEGDLLRWLGKSKSIQWDYKNIYKHKGKLFKLET